MTTDRAATLSAQIATVAALLAALAVLGGDPLGLPPAVAGAAALIAGAVRGSRRLVTGGGALLFVGVLGSALAADPFASLLGAALAVVAWDVAEHGIGVGEHLGHEASTRRLEVSHAAASSIVGLAAVGAGYGIYTVAWSGLPGTALALFVLAALFSAWALG